MIQDFHFLRPLWLATLLPLLIMALLLRRQKPRLTAWDEICDPHLLAHLMQSSKEHNHLLSLSCLFASFLFVIISLSGPTWIKLPVPTYKPIQPRVLVLDMSDAMLKDDLSPTRLGRAKFKLHDLLTRKEVGQFGLVVFTGEPFVVSPLTDDGKTIDSLLSMLEPDVLPVKGHNLSQALKEASLLIKNAGFSQGQILVMTSESPSLKAIELAKDLASEDITTSIMPVLAALNLNPLFARFATEGRGQVLKYSADATDIESWLSRKSMEKLSLNQQDDVPLWRDEGRWFLIPALLFLLPVFRRGWLHKVGL